MNSVSIQGKCKWCKQSIVYDIANTPLIKQQFCSDECWKEYWCFTGHGFKHPEYPDVKPNFSIFQKWLLNN